MVDPLAHLECLEFIRTAIASSDPQTARDVAIALTDCCECGYVDKKAIWADLSSQEQEQFSQLVKAQPANHGR